MPILWSRAEQYDKATGSVRVCVCMSLRVCIRVCIPCIPCTVYHTGPFRMHCALLCRTKGSLRERIPVLPRCLCTSHRGTFRVVSSSPPYGTVVRSLWYHPLPLCYGATVPNGSYLLRPVTTRPTLGLICQQSQELPSKYIMLWPDLEKHLHFTLRAFSRRSNPKRITISTFVRRKGNNISLSGQ